MQPNIFFWENRGILLQNYGEFFFALDFDIQWQCVIK